MSRKLTYDTWLFGAAMLIVVIGLVMIYSASAIITTQKVGSDNPYYFITRQCIWLIAGSALMLMLMHVDLARLRDRRVIYAAMDARVLAALIVVLFQSPINGTHRWIVLPWFNVQPSEFAKPVLVLFCRVFLARREERVNELMSTLLPLTAILALFAGLILIEPDFGTAMTLMFVAAGMIFAAGVRWKRIAAFGLMLAPAALMVLFSASYRRDRLLHLPQSRGRSAGQRASRRCSR